MSWTATRSRPRRLGIARRRRHIARYLLGGVALTALYLVGHGLLPQHTQDRPAPAIPAGQPVPDRQMPALLAQARARDPLLRLPHAHWFIRAHQGHVQIVVDDHAPRRDGGSVTGTEGGR